MEMLSAFGLHIFPEENNLVKLQLRLLALAILLSSQHNLARAGLVSLTVTNEGNSSFTLTPVWFGFDNGTFDLFTPGSAASGSLEALAEEGAVGGLQTDFGGSGTQGVITAPGGFPGAPVIEPGESGSVTVDVDMLQNRFLNFASMVIPSNDSFIGTPAPIEIFDAGGNFVGGGNSRTLTIFGNQIWDAGTEVNNTFGSPFSGQPAAGQADENGVVRLLAPPGLDNFLNTATPIGNITNLIVPGQAFATLTITAVPEPSSMALLVFGVGSALLRRRRRA